MRSEETSQEKHAPELTGEDLALLAGFHQTRRSLDLGRLEDAEVRLTKLEDKVGRKLVSLRKRSEAVADANARSVDILQGQMELNDQLRDQNGQLMEQQKQLRAMLQELEGVVAAVGSLPPNCTEVRQEVEQRTNTLLGQAVALAEANVRAVVMLEEREKELVEVKARTRELETTSQTLEEQAFMDALTGLFNHRYFSQQIGQEISRARRYGRDLSVAFVDLDNFKPINDQHGHQTGDRVLRWVGELVKHTLRSADITCTRTSGGPLLARYGGDEFVVILPETDEEGAMIAMNRVCSEIANTPVPLEEGSKLFNLTVSVGVANLRGDESAQELVGRADQAVYMAKKTGRNKVCLARSE